MKDTRPHALQAVRSDARALRAPAREATRHPVQPTRIEQQIGHTPLIELTAVAAALAPGVRLFAKGEHLNPGGSVKDRAAQQMIAAGLQAGALVGGKTLIDATSGNTGIAYAMLGAARGIPVALALPAHASPARQQMLQAYGATLILTDPMEGTDGAQRVVKEQVLRHPDRYFYPDQYNNDANWLAHYEGTGKEILMQTHGSVTHFVAALGTTGTFTGVSRRLKAHDAGIPCVAVHPDGPLHGLEGVKHLGTAQVPGIYDPALADRHLEVSTEEAFVMTRRLAREEGLLVGPSAGANVAAALRLAQTLTEGVVVTVLCDTGTRYLDADFWRAT